ncbi:MAG: hypothetical protein ACK41P_06720 [Asticcacaulis sp.]
MKCGLIIVLVKFLIEMKKMKIISNEDYFMVLNNYQDNKSRINNNIFYYWYAIEKIFIKRVNQITYDDEFYILIFENGRSVSVSEVDDGFSKFYAIMCSKFHVNKDLINDVIVVQVGDCKLIWSGDK